MSYKTFNKEIIRAITGSWGRFIAIFAIVALGVGFYAGLRMTAPDMDRAADAFYDATDLMDIRVVSTLGMTDDDLEALREIDGVEEVMGAYEADVIAEIHEEPYAIRIQSLPDSASSSAVSDDFHVSSDDPEYLNRLILRDGSWPSAPNECVISADRIMNNPVSIGDVFEITGSTGDVTDILSESKLTVVGLVSSSYYASPTSMGSTSLGSGRVEQFMYVPDDGFSPDYPYTEAFITVEGAKDLTSFTDEYQAAVDDVIVKVEAIAGDREQARLDGLRADAQKELDEAKADYEKEKADAERELSDARVKLDDASKEISRSEADIAKGQKDYDAGVIELKAQREQAYSKINEAQAQIDQNKAALDASEQQLAVQKAEFEASKQYMTPEQITQTEMQLQAAQLQIDQGRQSLAQAETTLATERDQAAIQLGEAQAKLDDAKRKLDDGRSQLEQGKSDYAKGVAEYDDARAEADEKFADAEKEIADAQADIDALEMPEWLVMDRTKNYGAESFHQDAGRIDNIAKVFPLIFFLVAALVALTTMTRMVDEERMLIGTYKALGYSRSRISSKYLIYAVVASLGGSIVGIAALSFTLPAIIMTAYSIVYIVPITALSIDWPIAIGATALGVGITLIATWAAVSSTLRESPAALMLPPAPKAGKRILLERIRPVWSRLSFLWKVTCRNIFRYKKRMVMTVIGIAGCTALLLTGFGLQNSINDIIDIHFGELVKYNTTITFEEDASDEDKEKLLDLLKTEGDVENLAHVMERNVVAVGDDKDVSVQLVVPEDNQEYEQIHVLREREGHAPLEISNDGVIVTEKACTLLGLDVGDTLTIAETDDMGNATNERHDVTVQGLAENYIYNTIFMSRDLYEQVFFDSQENADGLPNAIYVNSALDKEGRNDLAKDVREIDGVKTVSFNDETIDSYKKSLNSVSMVVYVLIIAAALLAFIVLYNLTNINITERIREIATLKVLGFTQREVQHYIFREIVILSILGAFVGLVLGVFLENFVVVTAEVEAVMFGRTIHWDSFVYAFLLTMAFTFIVTIFMRKKLNNVDMVESLKSNE